METSHTAVLGYFFYFFKNRKMSQKCETPHILEKLADFQQKKGHGLNRTEKSGATLI